MKNRTRSGRHFCIYSQCLSSLAISGLRCRVCLACCQCVLKLCGLHVLCKPADQCLQHPTLRNLDHCQVGRIIPLRAYAPLRKIVHPFRASLFVLLLLGCQEVNSVPPTAGQPIHVASNNSRPVTRQWCGEVAGLMESAASARQFGAPYSEVLKAAGGDDLAKMLADQAFSIPRYQNVSERALASRTLSVNWEANCLKHAI